jgi:response regulator RpfG family c-di-GMP phosphodiesterase
VGDAIPINGRIVALVDVFDALLSRRAYKEPWPVEQVVEELRRLRGNHLDPALVDLLLADVDHFHGIFLAHPD